MITRSAFGLLLDFNQDVNRLPAKVCRGWLPVALALSLLPGISLAQITPGPAGSQPPAPAQNNAVNGVSAPAGYILSANDQVAVEVFGEDDLRTNGRLNPEGNLSVPLLGSIRLAGLTLTQAASKLTDLYGRDYLVNPRVNVMLLGYAKRRF
jgi:protein involved in polysaccharide export with SLBB domain